MTDVEQLGEVTVAQHAHDVDRKIGHLRVQIEQDFLLMGGLLRHVQREHLWQPLGHKTFEDYLRSDTVRLPADRGYRLMRFHRELVEARQVAPAQLAAAGEERLREVIAAIELGVDNGGVSVEQGLSDATTLSRADLRKLYRHGRRSDEPLDAEAEPPLHECPSCGRVHEVKR